MAFTKEELDRFIDETHHRGLISGRVYCGTCGYNLKTLPYRYRCPECGNEYNARPLSMNGIFMPHQHAIPFRDMLTAAFCAGGAVMFAYIGYTSSRGMMAALSLPTLLPVIPLGGLAIHFAWRSLVGLNDYRQSLDVARRIAAEEAEDE